MAAQGKDLDEEGRALLAEDLAVALQRGGRRLRRLLSPRWRGAHQVRRARHRAHRSHAPPARHHRRLSPTDRRKLRRAITRAGSSRRSCACAIPSTRRSSSSTLAETTPVSEAAQLQADLRRAEIEPYAWVINSSLAAAGSSDPLLRQRIAGELIQIGVVRERHARRLAVVPWLTEQPVGSSRLLALVHGEETLGLRPPTE